MQFPYCRAGVAVLVAMIAAGCGGIADPSQRTTDTKTGTIPLLGTRIEGFNVSKRGELDIKLMSLTPTFANPLVINLGQQISGNCQFGSALGILTGQDLPFGLLDPGAYCVALSDPGTMTVAETYTINIVHP